MSTTQKIITSIIPKSWAQSMEDESQSWMLICSCGYKVSIWELGGIRWKASGNPRKYRQCSECGKSSWMTVQKEK